VQRRDEGISTFEVLMAMLVSTILILATLSMFLTVFKDQSISSGFASEAEVANLTHYYLQSDLLAATSVTTSPPSSCPPASFLVFYNGTSYFAYVLVDQQIERTKCGSSSHDYLGGNVTAPPTVTFLDPFPLSGESFPLSATAFTALSVSIQTGGETAPLQVVVSNTVPSEQSPPIL